MSLFSQILYNFLIEMPTDIDRNNLQRLMEEGAQLVEVISEKEYNEAHLPEAVNLPLKNLNAQSAASLDPALPVITYCNDFQ